MGCSGPALLELRSSWPLRHHSSYSLSSLISYLRRIIFVKCKENAKWLFTITGRHFESATKMNMRPHKEDFQNICHEIVTLYLERWMKLICWFDDDIIVKLIVKKVNHNGYCLLMEWAQMIKKKSNKRQLFGLSITRSNKKWTVNHFYNLVWITSHQDCHL